ncbi:Uncharacterised protein [Escherichia coli]|nr:Uncharacterised protein [Escherichia coli]
MVRELTFYNKRAFGTLILGMNFVEKPGFMKQRFLKKWAKDPLSVYHPYMFQVMLNVGYRYPLFKV